MIHADTLQPDFGILWPDFQLKDYERLPDIDLEDDLRLKEKIEAQGREDPVQFGWALQSWLEVCENWKTYDTHVVLGGNRSSKTSFGARLVIWLMENIPECRIRAYQVNDDKSIAEQQAYVWEALPDKYKKMAKKKGQAYSVQYSQKNGFVGGKLILPPQEGYRRGSECIFGNYQQYRNDAQVVEGWWAHFVWLDEEAPQKMYERLLTRLYDAHGRMLLTFTTIAGWSPLIADILGRTKTLRWRKSDLLARRLPVAQESLTRKGARIYYFWTQDNPFIPYDTIEKMRGRPDAEVLATAHGIPSRSALSKFPKFKEEVHVIKHNDLPWIKNPEVEVTHYMIIDPAGSKPWFMLWAAVDALGRVYVWGEWPDIGYGSWGEPSEKPEGAAGPAQKPNGYGIQNYIDEMKMVEDGVEIFERLIDSRMGNATIQGKESATTIQSELEEAGLVVQMAPGLKLVHGEQLINDRLGYDETKEVEGLNVPRLQISDRCEQLIEALKNFTGVSGREVWKDPIDCLRFLLEAGADYVPKVPEARAEGRTFSY